MYLIALPFKITGMASINFYLDRSDADGKSPIFLVYQSKGKKFKHFTQEKVLQKH